MSNIKEMDKIKLKVVLHDLENSKHRTVNYLLNDLTTATHLTINEHLDVLAKLNSRIQVVKDLLK